MIEACFDVFNTVYNTMMNLSYVRVTSTIEYLHVIFHTLHCSMRIQAYTDVAPFQYRNNYQSNQTQQFIHF